jgi:hypothetical protein
MRAWDLDYRTGVAVVCRATTLRPVLQCVAQGYETPGQVGLVGHADLLPSAGIRVEEQEHEPSDVVVDTRQLGHEL